MRDLVLNFSVNVEDVDKFDDFYQETIPADQLVLYCNGEEIWRDPEYCYIDRWGDSSNTAERIIIDKLRQLFK